MILRFVRPFPLLMQLVRAANERRKGEGAWCLVLVERIAANRPSSFLGRRRGHFSQASTSDHRSLQPCCDFLSISSKVRPSVPCGLRKNGHKVSAREGSRFFFSRPSLKPGSRQQGSQFIDSASCQELAKRKALSLIVRIRPRKVTRSPQIWCKLGKGAYVGMDRRHCNHCTVQAASHPHCPARSVAKLFLKAGLGQPCPNEWMLVGHNPNEPLLPDLEVFHFFPEVHQHHAKQRFKAWPVCRQATLHRK